MIRNVSQAYSCFFNSLCLRAVVQRRMRNLRTYAVKPMMMITPKIKKETIQRDENQY